MNQEYVEVKPGAMRVKEDGTVTLVGTKCRECGTTSFPGKYVCPRCLQPGTMEATEMGREGVLESFCTVAAAPRGFKPPYVLGVIRTGEGPLVATQMAVSPTRAEEVLRLGMRVRLTRGVIRTDEEGRQVYAWLYEPAV